MTSIDQPSLSENRKENWVMSKIRNQKKEKKIRVRNFVKTTVGFCDNNGLIGTWIK